MFYFPEPTEDTKDLLHLLGGRVATIIILLAYLSLQSTNAIRAGSYLVSTSSKGTRGPFTHGTSTSVPPTHHETMIGSGISEQSDQFPSRT